jgi:hypothetical protein
VTYRFRFLRSAWVWGLALLFLDSGVALAQAAVTTTPAQIQLPLTRTTPTYTIRWSIASSGPIIPPLTSAEGVFQLNPNSPPLGTVARPFVVTMPTTIDGDLISPVSVSETFRVPPDVVNAARAAGAASIQYSRTWNWGSVTGGQVAINGALGINFTGGLGGPFQVTRFDLQFDDRSQLRIAKQLESFKAIATVNYQGTGVISAVWEVSSVAQSRALQSQVAFRILKRVRRRLDGAGRIFLESPELPSQESGLHLVRLRFLEPDTAFELQPIRYFVSQGESATYGGVPSPLSLVGPPHLATIGEQTLFSWQAVAGVAAYQVEIFAGPVTEAASARSDAALESGQQRGVERSALLVDPQSPTGQFVTGAVLPASETGLLLSPPILAELTPGQRYFWRVRAIAADGSIVAQSPVLEFLVGAAALRVP